MNLKQSNTSINAEKAELVAHNSRWAAEFKAEAEQLLQILPEHLRIRIEHFGSTAIPSIMAKPVIDILIEVSSSEIARMELEKFLLPLGYEFHWRPTTGDEAVWYCWFIKRNVNGERTHHLHFVEKNSSMWKRLLFARYLVEHQNKAKEYESLKLRLAAKFPQDRSAYTVGKSEFVEETTAVALRHYGKI